MSTNLVDEMSETDAKNLLNEIFGLFGIGGQSRTGAIILTNIKNCMEFSELLHAVENEFFMVDGERDEEYPEDEPDQRCLVNSWGSSKEQYIEQFRAAIKAVAGK